MSSQQKKSFCRLCMGHCGVIVSTDEDGRLIDIRGDHEDPQTLGYACFKGMRATDQHNSPERILRPLKKMPDGKFEAISAEQALDEIAVKIQTTLSEHGPESIAGYKGSGAFFNSAAVNMLNEFLRALGSPKVFSSVTIDQSAKIVAAGRLGVWPAGTTPFERGEVLMIVGGNPLVSISTNGFDIRNPLKRLKQAKARGMKLIVIDPRQTETAKFADVFLQPLPGEDAAILAGMLRIILKENWHDKEFCQAYADDVDALEEGVKQFTPAYVAARAQVPEEELWRAAQLFAKQSRSGAATSATGANMSAFGNLTEHLLGCLNVICGRFLREGESVNPGAINARWPRKAEVIPASRSWEAGYQSRVGPYGLLEGELPSGILADEILMPGAGQVQCLIVHGGNPVAAIPDQNKIIKAFESLELLVCIEPFMSATAELADYILPPTLAYEREDLPLFIYESLLTPEPYTRYTDAIVEPPENAQVQDEHQYFFALAQRLKLSLRHFGEYLDMGSLPNTQQLLAIAARFAPISFAQLKEAELGVMLDQQPQYVEPGDACAPHRFSLLPEDVADELTQFLAVVDSKAFPYRLAVRRLRDAMNSVGLQMPAIKKRLGPQVLSMNPADMRSENFVDGELVYISSSDGEIQLPVLADDSLRTGVVTIPHGYGGFSIGENSDKGISVNLLISGDRNLDRINAMPRMSGIPLSIKKKPEFDAVTGT